MGMQAAAEDKAASSAKEGLEKRAREAESQAQALAETVEELRLALDRQRASTELRCTFLYLTILSCCSRSKVSVCTVFRRAVMCNSLSCHPFGHSVGNILM